MNGTMLWFNEEKNAGVLTTETGERLPVQGDDFASGTPPQGRCSGLQVEFRIVEDDGGRRATAIAVSDEIIPRRARRRASMRR